MTVRRHDRRPTRLRRRRWRRRPAPALVRLPRRPSLEAELAERLDTVLGIAERLAASHDREELFRTIVDETKRALRADARTIRDPARRPPGGGGLGGHADEVAAALPVIGPDEGWVGEVAPDGPGRRLDRCPRSTPTRARALRRRHRRSPATSSRRSSTTTGVIGALSAVTLEPRDWTSGDVAFVTTLATHAAIALTNAELFEQTETRAAQLGVLQAASGRLSRAGDGRGGRADRRRGDAPDHRLPQRPGLSHRAAGRRRADRLRGHASARTSSVDFELLRCKLGEGFTGWVAQHGEPLLVNDANSDPRGQTIPGTDDVDESMLVVPMRYDGVTVGVITLSKLGLDGFDADDLRLLTILADQAATAVESARLLTRTQDLAERAAAPARHERRAVREPRPAPGRRT